jgi:hypothetical protein
MKCEKCHDEWTSHRKITLSKCPFCGADIIATPNDNVKEIMSVESYIDPDIIYDGKSFGYKNHKGEMITSFKYDHAALFSEGTAVVKLKNKYGLINISGQEVISPKYDKVFPIRENEHYLDDYWGNFPEIYRPWVGWTIVKLDDKSGLIDNNGSEVIKLKYNNINFLSSSLLLVSSYIDNQLKYGIVDKNGHEVKPLTYSHINLICRSLCESLIEVKLNGKSGILDKDGRDIIIPKYDSVLLIPMSHIAVSLNDKWGLLNENGKEITPLKYDNVYYYGYNNMAVVELNGKIGSVDKHGNEVIPLKYDKFNFKLGEELAEVELNGKKGYINALGIWLRDAL